MSDKPERFVKSFPSFMDSPIWADDSLFKLFHYCLYKVSREDVHWGETTIKAGQLLFSQRSAAKQLGWSRDKVDKKLSALIETGLIQVATGWQGTIISIVNWSGLLIRTSESKPTCPENQATGGLVVEPFRPENQATTSSETRPACPENQATTPSETRPEWPENQAGGGPEIRPKQDKNKKYRETDIQQIVEPIGFEEFWLSYPAARRSDRPEAAALFQQALDKGATAQEITDALQAAKNSPDWCKEGGRYVPGTAKWLHRESWRSVEPQVQHEGVVGWVSK